MPTTPSAATSTAPASSATADLNQPHQARALNVTVSATQRFLLQLPKGYEQDPNKRWPVLFFLHGSGERGEDLRAVKAHGPPKLIEQRPDDWPFIVISPQVSEHANFDPHLLHGLLEQLKTELRIDPDRVTATGLSMGGRGVWAWAMAYPHDLAAIAPISGEGDDLQACRIKHLPVWAFHGERDTVVPFAAHMETIKALRECGGTPRWTPYAGVGHDAWTASYANPELAAWLLAQRRGAR